MEGEWEKGGGKEREGGLFSMMLRETGLLSTIVNVHSQPGCL